MSDDVTNDRVFLTPEEAEQLFPDGEYVHNFIGNSSMLIGCDYERAEAVAALREADTIEIGGDNCKAFKHPIAVTEKSGRRTFFAADMEKVAAFEAARVSA